MATTTESSKPTPTPTKATPANARVVLVWNPENDSTVPKPPIGTPSPRPFIFSWFDAAEMATVAKRREAAEQQFRDILPAAFRSVRELKLQPGLNWIDAALWEESKTVSADRSFDQIDRLLQERAIQVLQPVNGDGSKIADYDLAAAKQIIDLTGDLKTLMEFQSLSRNPALSDIIVKRIEKLQGKF